MINISFIQGIKSNDHLKKMLEDLKIIKSTKKALKRKMYKNMQNKCKININNNQYLPVYIALNAFSTYRATFLSIRKKKSFKHLNF